MFPWKRKVESAEYRSLSNDIIRLEKLIGTLQAQMDTLQARFHKLEGRYYATKRSEEESESDISSNHPMFRL